MSDTVNSGAIDAPATTRPGSGDTGRIDRKVPWVVKGGYGVGSFPDSIYFYAWDLFVLFFYTQVLGLPGSLVGIAIFLAMLLDAVSDAYVGHLSDNLKGMRYGRRHTLMAASIIPLAGCFMALFMPPAGLPDWALFAWLLVFALASRLAITFYVIPYKAVGAELSRNVVERPQIFAAAALGNAAARIALPMVAFGVFFIASEEFERGQLDPSNYPAFAIAFGLAMAVTMLVPILSTYRPMIADERAEKRIGQSGIGPIAGLRSVLRALTVTPNIRLVLLLALFVFISVVSISVLKIHTVTYLWQVPRPLIGPLISAQAIGSAIGAFLLPILVRPLDRRMAIGWGFGGFAVLNGLAVLLPVIGLAPAAGSEALAYMLIGLFFAGGLSLGAYFVCIGAISGDVADEHEVNTGQRQQGLISGFSTFIIKAASGVMTMITGFYLDLIQFPVGVPVEEVPQAKVDQLAYFILAFCVIAAGAVGYIVSRIEVSLDKQKEINSKLQELLDKDA